MIIQDEGDQLVLIRQTDHALLAGFFAREWGNKVFARAEPFESFRMAAAEHDNGWKEWELEPCIDPVTFNPYSFMSLPTVEHIELYKTGIERIVKVDRYAGLMVSMHAAGLYDKTRATMPGFSAKYVKSNESHHVSEFVQRLRLQQLRLKVDLRADAATKRFTEEKALAANLQRLEALDRLSLYFSQETACREATASGSSDETTRHAGPDKGREPQSKSGPRGRIRRPLQRPRAPSGRNWSWGNSQCRT